MKNISIAILTPSDFSGNTGDTSNFLEMINYYLLEGLQVLLICPKNSKNEYPNFNHQYPNLEILKINCKPPRMNEIEAGKKFKKYFEFAWFLLIETVTVIRIIRSRKIKKMYVRHSILTLQLPLFFKLLGITTMADGEIISGRIKDLLSPFMLKLFSFYEKKMIRFYSFFKVSTEPEAKYLTDWGYPQENVIVIPVSINIDKIPKFDLKKIIDYTFGYFGGLEPWQSIDVLIKAFKFLIEKIPTALLYIIGDGSLKKELEELVLSNKLTNNIIFIGSIKREKLWEQYFSKFRIVIIPRQKLNSSIDPILPIKLIEALAASKPIIAVDIPVMREIPGNPIVLIPSGNSQLLANAMYSLSTDINEMNYRSMLSSNSSKSYDIKVNLKKIISILSY